MSALTPDDQVTLNEVKAHYEAGFGDLDHAAEDVAELLAIIGRLDAARASRPEPGADLAGLPPATCYRVHTQPDEHKGVVGAVWLADVRRALAALPASPEDGLREARMFGRTVAEIEHAVAVHDMHHPQCRARIDALNGANQL